MQPKHKRTIFIKFGSNEASINIQEKRTSLFLSKKLLFENYRSKSEKPCTPILKRYTPILKRYLKIVSKDFEIG